MSGPRKMNWNTLLLTIIIGAGTWAVKEVYSEVRQTHDHVLVIETKLPELVTKSEFDLTVLDIRSRLTVLESKIHPYMTNR